MGGRYWLPARVDLGLTRLLRSGKLFVGQKLRVVGASFHGCEDGLPPLEVPPSPHPPNPHPPPQAGSETCLGFGFWVFFGGFFGFFFFGFFFFFLNPKIK